MIGYYFNKIITWCLSPLGVLYIAIPIALLLYRKGWRRTARWMVVCVLSFLWVLGAGVTTRLIGVPLERMSGSSCILDYDSIPNADAIVLLGGGMGYHKKCGSPEISSAADRVWVAARLWKLGKAKVITLTGGNAEKGTVPLLKDLGVDESACMFLDNARNTYGEAKVISDSGIRKILLVTSAWHMPRAKMLFERRGFEVVPCPADFEMTCAAENSIEFLDFLPGGDGIVRNSYCIKEWIALLGYSIFRN